ncbi:MAG: hypothetical protein DRP11_05560 [Candidatus Aenigmatarchaeota archaeon]|nr:MAG: hypothetical protein DRP11_05560 [Candidatus Aenigmarchaeota archaeon]
MSAEEKYRFIMNKLDELEIIIKKIDIINDIRYDLLMDALHQAQMKASTFPKKKKKVRKKMDVSVGPGSVPVIVEFGYELSDYEKEINKRISKLRMEVYKKYRPPGYA